MTATNQPHIIDTFPLDQPAEAEAYAASIGATTEVIPYDPARFGGGYIQISHPNAEGITVERWSGTKLPAPAKLVRRDSLQAGDIVFSSYKGRSNVKEVLYDGRESGFFRHNDGNLEAGTAESLIPLLERPNAENGH
jgi:hypothetical protein